LHSFQYEIFIKFDGYSAQSIRHQLDSPSYGNVFLPKDYALRITTENEKRIILDVDKVAVLIFKGKC
jgi:hypothetical protein